MTTTPNQTPRTTPNPSSASAPPSSATPTRCGPSSTVSLLPGETPREAERRILRDDPDAAWVWDRLRHDHQWPPEDRPWTTWLLMGGRGAGKTRAGAEWIRHLAETRLDPGAPGRFGARSIALVAESYADAREIMIEGPSGILACSHPSRRPAFSPSRRRLDWPNGAVARLFSAEDPDGLRGFEFYAAWSDELCKWRYPEETWSNLQLALRLGPRPRQAVTTTPRPTALIKRLLKSPETATTRASSHDNAANLSPAFFAEIVQRYHGTRLGRQELMGELIEDVEGALWTWNMIEAARVSAAPELDEIVVAVDPPASAGPAGAACGLIVAGRAGA
ncbi:MAG: DNA-packaging protein, partial [Parvularculaceae bacterium]|nr:DNA-packaging protein [Parvularculaceae bacterium]